VAAGALTVPLDIRTIVVMLVVTAVLMTVTLALDLRPSAPGLRHWNAGLGFFAAGWLLIALRGAVPPIASIAFANALLMAGLCSQYAGLREFRGQRVPRWLVPVPAAALFLLTLALLDRYAPLTLLTSGAFSIALLATAAAAARLEATAGPVRWLLCALEVGAAASLVLRAADIALRPDATPGMFAGSLLHAAAYVMLFAVTISASLAFLVMQRRRSEEALRHMAMFDALTELYNRRAFLQLGERELARSQRAGVPTAALMLDLDRFKAVNDRHGHVAGDRVLAEFADRLRRAVRLADLPGRYGGEEFCVLLPGLGLEEARVIAERVRRTVAVSPLGGLPDATTVSIGVTACDDSEGPIDVLLARADEALYAAKEGGRNRVHALPLDSRPGKAGRRPGAVSCERESHTIS